MSNTVCVLALDAADYELLKKFDCENVLLEKNGPLEVFTHNFDVPQTTEVWPTIATGLSPEEHGMSRHVRQWDNPILQSLSQITAVLPNQVRTALGVPFRAFGVDRSIEQTSTADHVFDEAFGWPGITPAEHLYEAWQWYSEASDGELTVSELSDRLRANTGQEFGWLAAMSRSDAAVIGVHSHVLDVAGHLFATEPERLQSIYNWVDDLLGWLREYVDQLVVLSDHGMETSVTGDDEPGNHSWRAMVATQGISGPLPSSAYDVREWLEDNAPKPTENDESEIELGEVEQHLSDLGYIE
ncbi:alkaline phosphatase family protein [Halopiger thermotolerans]